MALAKEDSAYSQFDNKQSVAINKTNETKEQRLWEAIKNEQLVNVTSLLYAGARVDSGDTYGNTALQFACEKGNVDIFSEILSREPKINKRDNMGQSAMMFCCLNGHFEITKLLIAAKASLNVQSTDGQTALMKAAYGRYQHTPHIVRLLVEGKAELNLQRADGRTSLMIACEQGNVDAATTMLQFKANPNVQLDNGATALHLSANTGSALIVEMLAKYGADPSLEDDNGKMFHEMPLQKSVSLKSGGEEVVRSRLKAAGEAGQATFLMKGFSAK